MTAEEGQALLQVMVDTLEEVHHAELRALGVMTDARLVQAATTTAARQTTDRMRRERAAWAMVSMMACAAAIWAALG